MLGLGEAEAALALYDERVCDPASDEYLDLCNDAALLQRLEIAGLGVGERWAHIADKIRGQLEARILVFIDAHYALALAAAGDREAADRLRAAIAACAAAGAGTTAAIAAETGRALCEGLVAYRAGDWTTTVERLAPLRGRLARIGGSHAQRDLFTQILVDAAARAGRLPLARAILSECTAARPGNRWYRDRLAELAPGPASLNGMRSWQNPFAPQYPSDTNHLNLEESMNDRELDYARFRKPHARRAVLAPRLPRVRRRHRLRARRRPADGTAGDQDLRRRARCRGRDDPGRWRGADAGLYGIAEKKSGQVPGHHRHSRGVRAARVPEGHRPSAGEGRVFRDLGRSVLPVG